jgi:hypothetical protein
LEAALVVLSGKRVDDIGPADYLELIEKLGFQPRIERFSAQAAPSGSPRPAFVGI